MPRYVIEREFAGAGELTAQQLQNLSRTAVQAAQELAPDVQWLQSFVAHDKIYCIYVAPDEEVLWRLSERAGFPTHRVSEITSVIDPTTAKKSA